MKNTLYTIITVLVVLGVVFGLEGFRYKLCRAQNLSPLYCLMQK